MSARPATTSDDGIRPACAARLAALEAGQQEHDRRADHTCRTLEAVQAELGRTAQGLAGLQASQAAILERIGELQQQTAAGAHRLVWSLLVVLGAGLSGAAALIVYGVTRP